MTGLVDAIAGCQARGVMPVIAEIKVRSPKEGDLLRGRSVADLVRAYATRPIAGISVVTEPNDFGGSLDIVEQVRALTDLPILRKDFPRSRADFEAGVRAGATTVLMTVRMLDPESFPALHAQALELGLETLVELHDQADAERVRDWGLRPSLIGVNNRDIAIGETDDGDVTRTERLAAQVGVDAPLVSESAIAGAADARRARDAGADAVLVGTAILTAPDPGAMIDELVGVGWAR